MTENKVPDFVEHAPVLIGRYTTSEAGIVRALMLFDAVKMKSEAGMWVIRKAEEDRYRLTHEKE